MVKLAGRQGDGVILSLATHDHIRQIRRWLDEAAAEAGRDPSELKIYMVINTIIRNTREEARPFLKQAAAGYFTMPFYQRQLSATGIELKDGSVSDSDADKLGIVGDVSDAKEQIAAYREAGIDVPCISPMGWSDDPWPAYLQAAQLLR
jgi:alkanesulfonate monooxygenase SsuD/methylene tetrahydromethanopterin reductase-like flavin-dependent oxidoreductase (luciferase family)